MKRFSKMTDDEILREETRLYRKSGVYRRRDGWLRWLLLFQAVRDDMALENVSKECFDRGLHDKHND